MSTEQALTSVSILAGADLSAKQYLAVSLATDNSGVKLVGGAGLRVDGILQNKPVEGQPATVAIAGITKVLVGVGDVASAGLRLQADVTGAVIAASTGDYVLGISLDAGVAGDVIRVLLKADHLNA